MDRLEGQVRRELGRFGPVDGDMVGIVRAWPEAVGETVSLADVRVAAGDFIVGDEDGMVVVPRARATEVFERALVLRAAEQRIVAATLAGASLEQARRQAAYHTLQRAES